MCFVGLHLARVRFSRLLAILALLGSAACWGSATVLGESLLRSIGPFQLLATQLGFSVLFLVLLDFRAMTRVWSNTGGPRAASAGLLEPGLAYALGVPGLLLTTASSATVISGTEPAITVLLAWWLLGQIPARIEFLFLVLIIGGIVLMGAQPSATNADRPVLGNLLVLGGTVAASMYVIESSRAVRTFGVRALAATQQLVGFGLALIVLGCAWSTGYETPVVPTATQWALVAFSGLVQYAVAFSLYLFALKELPPGRASLFLALTPIFGLAGAAWFLGERITGHQTIGAGLVVASLVGLGTWAATRKT